MKRDVILDTGPLVAFLNRNDKFHQWSLAQWGHIEPPIFTYDAVISEACILLGSTATGAISVMQMMERNVVSVPFRLDANLHPVKKLLAKYRFVQMSLADACLARISELNTKSQILTVNSDLNFYRKHGHLMIPIIMPQ